jgi:hypothetical protein
MRAILLRDFRCCPGGVVIETFKEGEVVEGFVAIDAVRQGAGKIMQPQPWNPVEEVKSVNEVRADRGLAPIKRGRK